jgi:peptidyl-prolyl cis-trans isomerase SurA
VRSRFITAAGMAFMALLVFVSAGVPAKAQEGEVTVVDEVIAQVNDDVITLSMLKRENKERVEALVQRGMTEQQANDEVAKHQAELIATLVNEKLLLQKGKELEMASEIETEVNRRMLEIAREQGINSIQKLEEVMIQNKINPANIRETMRSEMMKQAVLQQEVDRRVYLGPSTADVKKYYDAHPDKFRTPETITMSEIYLSTNNKDDASVKARATELVAQLRAGADFSAVASANSEREKNGKRTAPEDGGKVGTFEVANLREDLLPAIKDVKVGGISEPIRTQEGYQILKIDARTPAGTTPTFNENKVREAMLFERQDKEREAYLQNLRNEAFIKVSETYKDSVEPLLKLNAPVAAKGAEKEDSKKSKKP